MSASWADFWLAGDFGPFVGALAVTTGLTATGAKSTTGAETLAGTTGLAAAGAKTATAADTLAVTTGLAETASKAATGNNTLAVTTGLVASGTATVIQAQPSGGEVDRASRYATIFPKHVSGNATAIRCTTGLRATGSRTAYVDVTEVVPTATTSGTGSASRAVDIVSVLTIRSLAGGYSRERQESELELLLLTA